MAYSTGVSSLAVPPPTANRTGDVVDWGLLLNDVEGDCTCATAGHMQMAWTAVTQGKPVIVPDSAIQQAYVDVAHYDPATGANDNGAACLDVLEYWRTVGIGGNKIIAHAAIDPNQSIQVESACYYYGGVYIGVQLPASAVQQTDAGEAWTVPWFSPIVGGHAIPIVAYSPEYLWVVTWGKLQTMSWDFLFRYCDEAYVALDSEWIAANDLSPTGLNLTALTADLDSLAQAA